MPVIRVWGEGRDALWTPDGLVSVPKNYDLLPSGNAALTRAVKKATGRKRLFVVMEKRHKKYPSQPVGVWAPASVIAAERERLAPSHSDAHKAILAVRRARQQEREVVAFLDSILKRFPGCPADEAREIAAHACEVGSGRVGRSSTADDPVRAAVVAHIRHVHTDYDDLLDSRIESWMDFADRQEVRAEAREHVSDQIDEILGRWEASTTVSEMTGSLGAVAGAPR